MKTMAQLLEQRRARLDTDTGTQSARNLLAQSFLEELKQLAKDHLKLGESIAINDGLSLRNDGLFDNHAHRLVRSDDSRNGALLKATVYNALAREAGEPQMGQPKEEAPAKLHGEKRWTFIRTLCSAARARRPSISSCNKSCCGLGPA